MSTDNITFSDTYLREHSVCQPTKDYNWAFSSLLLLVFCLLTLIFATTLTALHGHAFWNSKTDRFRYDINHYKDAVHLVHELESRQLGASVRSMSGRELMQDVNQNDSGTGLETPTFPPTRKEEWRQKKEEWKQHQRQKPPASPRRIVVAEAEFSVIRKLAELRDDSIQGTERQRLAVMRAKVRGPTVQKEKSFSVADVA